MKILRWLGMVLLAAASIAPARAQAACTASATHYCIFHDGQKFLLKSDPAGAYTAQLALKVVPGLTYTFEVDAAIGGLASFHPFYLTDSSLGGGQGTSFSSPLSMAGGSFTFTPSAAQLSAGLFYQCNFHGNEGAAITAAPACSPGFYNNNGSCLACSAVPNCASPVTCTTATDSQCTACATGYYASNGACVACTAVSHCVSPVACTSPTDSQCTVCAAGYYASNGTCAACTAVAGCVSPVTCTSPTDSQCTACAAGYYASNGTCAACTAVSHCVSPVACTSPTDSQCTACAAGYYASNGACAACTPVAGCASPITCTTAANSQCTACGAGFYASGGVCTACTPVPGCASGLTCTNAANSQCSTCAVPDHLNCYPAKDLKNPAFVKKKGVSVSDEFASSSIDAVKPQFLCAPASVDGSPVTNPQSHLCCYQTKAPKLAAPKREQATDGFGTLELKVGKSTLLCRPCTTTLLP